MSATAIAEQEIRAAWDAYRVVEKHGLEFGRVCWEWQQRFVTTERGLNAKGKGLRPILDSIGIPKSTAYFWIDRYKESLSPIDGEPPLQREPASPIAALYKRLSTLFSESPDSLLQILPSVEQQLRSGLSRADDTDLAAVDTIVLKLLPQFIEEYRKLRTEVETEAVAA